MMTIHIPRMTLLLAVQSQKIGHKKRTEDGWIAKLIC